MSTFKNNFEYLGVEYQEKLISQLLLDERFYVNIVKHLKPSYFSNDILRKIVHTIMNVYETEDVVLDSSSLRIRLNSETNKEETRDLYNAYIDKLEKASTKDWEYVQNKAFEFCQEREIIKIADKIKSDVDKNSLSTITEYEESLQKVFNIGKKDVITEELFDDIDLILSEDSRKPIPTGVEKLDQLMNGGLAGGELAVVIAPLGVGKAQPLDTPTLTPNGWVKIGDIKVGDVVFGNDGNKTNVIGVYPQGNRPVYEIRFYNGLTTRCDENHLWGVYDENDEYRVINTSELILLQKEHGHISNYKVPYVKPIQFDKQDLELNPIAQGISMLLTNGYVKDLELSLNTEQYSDLVKYFKSDKSFKVSKSKENHNIKLISETTDYLDLNKILYNDVDTRIDFIKGLNLTDYSFGDSFELQKNLSDNEIIIEIIRSLGGNISEKNGIFVVTFETYNHMDVINYIHHEETVCIKVDNKDELYVTNDYIVTHNTTISTKFANTAFNLGNNVLQIFFEDSVQAVKKKHIACWTGIEINELKNNKERVKEIVNKKVSSSNGKIFFARMSSITTTMVDIKNLIIELRQKGIIIHQLILDYIDCVQPSKYYSDPLLGEAMTMREVENLGLEFNIASWVMTQGNRSSIGSKVVDTDQIGGSIKKAQIGHFILTIARPQEQKAENKATLAIVKSRLGVDGVIYDNVKFNNGTLEIEILPNQDGTEHFVVAPKHSSDMSDDNKFSTIMSKLKQMSGEN